MKKLLAILGVLIGFSITSVYADTSTVQATTLTSPGQQLELSLLQHVVGITEFTSRGQTKLEFLDGLVEMGKYKGDYILALDGGFANSVTPDNQGHLATTWGVHAHVISALRNYLTVNPDFATLLDSLEFTPRYSYDADVHHGVLGFTFGAVIPFGGTPQ